MEEHQDHLEQVLSTLASHQLYANLKKCEIGKEKVAYLGHVISALGVEVDASKVRAMMEWPVPLNLKSLRGFLGLTGYYRKFIKDYALIARPLTDQLRKECWGWTAEATQAFESLKAAMTRAPILAMPNFSQPFVVETDASGYGLGAVLLQGVHPVAYFSKVLGIRAREKPIYEKELMAIVFAVEVATLLTWATFCCPHRPEKHEVFVRTKSSGASIPKMGEQVVGIHFRYPL